MAPGPPVPAPRWIRRCRSSRTPHRRSRCIGLAMAGSQDFAADPRNADLRIYVNGALVPRAEAKVSIFDAGFVLGDGVWEGLRLHKGALVFLDAHLDRLYAGLQAIALPIGLTKDELAAEIRRTLATN